MNNSTEKRFLKVIGSILIGIGIIILFFHMFLELSSDLFTLVVIILYTFIGYLIFMGDSISKLSIGIREWIKIEASIKKARDLDKALSSKIEIAEERIKNLLLSNEFTATAIRAQYDYNALEQMNKLSNDKSFPSASEAKIVYNSILEHNDYNGNPPIDWPSTFSIFNSKQVSIEDIKSKFSIANSNDKRQIIGYLWQNSNFRMKDKMRFFIENLKNENDVLIISYLGKFFINASQQAFYPGLSCKPLEKDEILDWWEKNKNNISDK